MAVSRRLRFEILRRDGHTCRYCGQSAPDVKLTVDHVVPETLGGGDEPSNLATACAGCNAGKSSIAPDSALVDDVALDALRFAEALRRAMHERRLQMDDLADDIRHFDEAWSAWKRGTEPIPRSADWANTLERWIEGGLDVTHLVHKIPLAMRDTISRDGEWRFFCGIGWGMLTDLQTRARELADLTT